MATNRFETGAAIFALREAGPGGPRATLLLLHGLGDSGRAFAEAFGDARLAGLRLLAPDMPGHGDSAGLAPAGIGLDDYVAALRRLLDARAAGAVILAGHSLGGAVATLLAAADPRVRGLVNVEGNLTEADLFLSGRAVAADAGGRFPAWFARLRRESSWRRSMAQHVSNRRYYESLVRCAPAAFLRAARELAARTQPDAGTGPGEFAARYLALAIPRLFCLGGTCPAGTRALLAARGEAVRVFPDAGHGVMVDAPAAFYGVLREFVDSVLAVGEGRP
ncbi:MAG: alpha/beta fold hydrolase [Candidatus Krumholzibacteriota bacterium]|nr:alpha/beta fold hydrolase [Candidatus Krumholzibacteriota bacterium]